MIIREASQYKSTQWKNGGGTTAEIGIHPSNADLQTFDWRVSTATVAMPGPFSIFPGIDRTLSVLGGGRLLLEFEDGRREILAIGAEPFSFPADIPVHGIPLDGPITDLNVMTRRRRSRHEVVYLAGTGRTSFVPKGAACLVFTQGGCRLSAGDEQVRMLSAGATAILEPPYPEAIDVAGTEKFAFFVIDLFDEP